MRRSLAGGRVGAPVLVALVLGVVPRAVASEPAVEAVARQRADLVRSIAHMDARPDLFPGRALEGPRLLPPGARAEVRSLWGAVGDRIHVLEALSHRYAPEPSAGEGLGADGARGLQLHRAAFLARYRHAMEFIERIERNPALHDLLDELHPQAGLPAGAYAELKLRYLHVARASEFAALELLGRTISSPMPTLLAPGAEADARRILELGRGVGPRLTVENAWAVVRDVARDLRMPAQEGLARLLGEVRVRRQGESLVSPVQIAALPGRLEPGDILLERREWYLTNAGIPGFWPHAALYVGTRDERERFFADPDTRAWLAELGVDSFEALLAERHPDALVRSQRLEEGHPRRVLEAIAEGVVFTSLEHSAAADSLAVLRPRLTRRERAVALLRAFGHAGRPYDYDFDFATDAALVCSELVYKAYQPGEGSRGLRLPLSEVAGRLLMSPNEIARLYAEERGRPDAQLDFVLLLDGDEGSDRAHEAGAEVFAASWQRPKWHILVARETPAAASR